MEKKKSIDKLNELAIRDIDTLKYVKEEEIDFIEYIAKGCSQEVPRLYDRVPPIIKYNRGNEELIRIVLDYYKSIDSEMYEQAKSIVMGQNDIPIAIYNRKDITRKRGQVEKELSGYDKFLQGSQIQWDEGYRMVYRNKERVIPTGKIYVQRRENDYDIYSGDPMYTFVLTPSIIKEIRRYNSVNSYADYTGSLDGKNYDYKCNNGSETGRYCISDYLSYIINITGAKNEPGSCVADKYRNYNDTANFEACRY